MRLVLAALRRPMTVVVALIAIALGAVLAVERMHMDIFPVTSLTFTSNSMTAAISLGATTWTNWAVVS